MNLIDNPSLQINPLYLLLITFVFYGVPTLLILYILNKLDRKHSFILIGIYISFMLISVVINKYLIGVRVSTVFFGLLLFFVIKDYIYD